MLNIIRICLEEISSISLDYLKSIGEYPNAEEDKLLTGQLFASIILSHIDFDDQIYSPKRLECGSVESTFSFEFHPRTFQLLFDIIEQLAEHPSTVMIHILTVCLRLFTTHLKFLGTSATDLSTFANTDQLNKWFHRLLQFACDENQRLISVEASNALVYLINLQKWSFTEKLSFIHKYIQENQYPILIEHLLIELNKEETMMDWIELLCDKDDQKPDKTTALNILYLFIDSQEQRIMKSLLSFQQLLIYRLIPQFSSSSTSTVVIGYITHIFKHSMVKESMMKHLFNSILIYLTLMTKTKTNEIFDFTTIQPIFAAVLPLLADFLLQNSNKEDSDQNNLRLISWLLGKMTQAMITGSSLDSLELKHADKLKLILFSGGCEKSPLDQSEYHLSHSNLAVYSQSHLENQGEKPSSDEQFLISIYNNVDQGAQLISKMKRFAKNKQHLLQASIEQQANQLSAAVFSVYIKHYRRINLAKFALSQADQIRPSTQLISIFNYANHVQTLLATIKAQGGDCDVFSTQIKAKTFFLLKTVRENNSISIINDVLTSLLVAVPEKKEFRFQRQISQWSKAKHVIGLLRNLMDACIQFRKLILSKKQISELNFDYESLLNRTIDQFIYGDFYKMNTSISTEQTELILNELEKCLVQQHERATIRLITYQFVQTFVQQISNLKDQHQAMTLLVNYLPYLRNSGVEWSYLENIFATNIYLKEEIRKSYYSIIEIILQSTIFQSNLIKQHIFYLSNLNYESADIHHLRSETLFISFVESPDDRISLDLKLTAFNWFRLFVFKLCENIQMDILRGIHSEGLQQQQTFVFNELILNELRRFKSRLTMDKEDEMKNNSLKNISLGWFHQAIATTFPKKPDINLYVNQYLILLFRCIHFYEHIRTVCATDNFIGELLDIYHHSQHKVTRLLTLKITRQLISNLQKNQTANNLIEKFLAEVLLTIGGNFTSSEIVTELINIYRTILSVKSSWQTMAIQMVFDSIISNVNLETLETNELNKLIASLCILGGYIQPHCLGSIVNVYNDDGNNDEFQLALILEISDESSYTIQYLQTNQIQTISVDKIELEIDVTPPDLLSLPTTNAAINSILDALANLIQLDTSTTESVVLLQLKRRAMSTLYHILNNQKIVEMFMQKPYAITIAELSISHHHQLANLRLFNKQHLEQYCLSLDNYERLQTFNDENDSSDEASKHNRLIIETLSTSVLKYNGWKSYVSKSEIQLFQKGRLGNNEIAIVPMPNTAADREAIKQCGTKHQFNGRINPTSDNTHVNLPTFILDNVQVSEGNWYFCVRVPMDGVQVGWATNGFTPRGNDGKGIGDDQYSWSYDGSRAIFLNDGVYNEQFNDTRWKENDVCGCGIEINGGKTNIKYWLNGKLLGTAFQHDTKIHSSYTTCNLLPHEQTTTYFPGITVQFGDHPSTFCEFIFSPEDMQQCPLPDGYKPLLLPKLINTENSIIAYPFSAYLVGDNPKDYFCTSRTMTSTDLLRDFVSEYHLKTEFVIDDHQLILPIDSTGFPLSIDNDTSSFTISFDFQLFPQQLDMLSLISDATEIFTLKIPLKEIDGEKRVVIVFHPNEQQAKIYLNYECQTFETPFPISKFNFYLLPKIAAKIRNIGVWKYALSEDHIQRLFTYGLFYVATDYQQLKEYRKCANTFSFKQKEFPSELLVPFDQSFDDNIWKIKQKHADHNEAKYFSSAIELFENKTYLVLKKSIAPWTKYTLILDISIPQWPSKDKQLSLVALNDKSHIFITDKGKLCLKTESTNHENESNIVTNEYVRLWISVDDQSIKIYINGSLEIDTNDEDDRFHATLNRFDLFRETNPTKNNKLRIQCRSITFLNRSTMIDEQMQTPDNSLEALVALPLSIISPNLIAIGYKKQWIQSAIEESKTTNIQMIDTILREQKDKFLQSDLEDQRKHYLQILSRITPEIDFSEFDVHDIGQRILTNWNDQNDPIEVNSDDDTIENQWFHRTIKGLAIDASITEWFRDRLTTIPKPDIMCQLFDFNQKTTRTQKQSIQYSHRNLSQNKYFNLRLACENGLTIIYARHTLLNILEIWSNDSTSSFPFEKFCNPTVIITLFRLIDYHSVATNLSVDRIGTLIYSILKSEIKQVLECLLSEHEMNKRILHSKAPFISQLQTDIVVQSLRVLFEPSLLEDNSDGENLVNEQILIKQPNLKFIFKVLNLFIELLKDKSLDEINFIVPLLFPKPLINLLFDLFLSIQTHQSKIFILHIFAT